MNKKVIAGVVALLIIVLAYIYASPYLVLNTIKKAAQQGDSEKVSAYVDYPSVRQSLKDQMNAHLMKDVVSDKADGWEAFGAMVATTMVEKVVDSLVSPQGLTLMMQGKDFKDTLQNHQQSGIEQSEDKPKLEYSTRYLSMNMFEATLKNLNNNKMLKVIMERDGLSWKVKKFVLPLDAKDAQIVEAKPVQPQEIEEPVEEIVVPETTSVFDHSGVQPGKTMEFCYRDPCSVAQVKNFQILNQTPSDVDLELTLLGGSKGWEQEAIEWSDNTHKIQITCSIEKPTVRMDGQVTVIPLNNDMGVPGVLMTDAEMYLQACHGDFDGTMEDATQHYGYDVKDAN
ncbi:DUF2939 domain-containing protein [uncultured Acinetobacter sp.]|uniref:DUF2939 domain-containing protein n=1 Tax=uncultured Acinetobacter sp. TaxID=165433 RepID=UPI00261B280C|nr:DUF2939 domain-containing protein [uncultured Acinetobacter sp.]